MNSSSSAAGLGGTSRPVRIWLMAGVVMVFFQIIIGGATRLTDSGLSITEWAVIQGTIPPLNEAEWTEAFDKYKAAAKKQFEMIHADMTLPEFKVIFFWEYAHRLWARLMGFVFIIPFFWFLLKKQLPRWLLLRLAGVIGLASLAAVFGWIMVASGLNKDNRTWVSAYKLVIHLGIAAALFGYLFWTWLKASQSETGDGRFSQLRKWGWAVAAVLFVQILFGGLMAGMRAGLIHPQLSVFIQGSRFWSALTASSSIGMEQIVDYEQYLSVKAIVQLVHRSTAWVLALLILIFFVKLKKSDTSRKLKMGGKLLLLVLGIQIFLGLFTVINSIGRIPGTLGVLHQAGALVLLAVVLFLNYQLKDKKFV